MKSGRSGQPRDVTRRPSITVGWLPNLLVLRLRIASVVGSLDSQFDFDGSAHRVQCWAWDGPDVVSGVRLGAFLVALGVRFVVRFSAASSVRHRFRFLACFASLFFFRRLASAFLNHACAV